MWLILSFVVAWAMSHLLVFCRESHFVANTCFLGLFCADFYADIWDLTQILRKYLDKKSAAESSALYANCMYYNTSLWARTIFGEWVDATTERFIYQWTEHFDHYDYVDLEMIMLILGNNLGRSLLAAHLGLLENKLS